MLPPRTARLRFRQGQIDQPVKDILGIARRALDDQEPRQRREQRVERPDVAAEIAADIARPRHLAAAFIDNEGQVTRGHLTEEGHRCRLVELGPHAGLAQHGVGVPMRKDEDVAGLEPYRLPVAEADPAAAFEDDMVGDHLLRAGQNDRGEAAGGRHFDPPGRGRLDQKEEGAGEPDLAKHVGQRIQGSRLRPLFRPGRHGRTHFARAQRSRRRSKKIGRAVMGSGHARS